MNGFGEAVKARRMDVGLSLRALARLAHMDPGHLSKIENGKRPAKPAVVKAIDNALGADGQLTAIAEAERAARTPEPGVSSYLAPSADALSNAFPISARTVDLVQRGEDEINVRRREFVGLTGAALFNAVVSEAAGWGQPSPDIEGLASTLTEYATPDDGVPDLARLAATVAAAKQNYQACRYSEVVTALPSLLRAIRVACAAFTGDALLRAQMLSAEAHHVTASILLKQDDKSLAWLAADRSVQAARASQSPLMIGSSTRIIAHALTVGGHYRAATDTASVAAARMDADLIAPSPDELSVYGSLLLRGAVAAAQHGNRHATGELLDEAERASRRLGHDGNHMWTAFGPNNVLCHRVSTALTLGDAGTAVQHARRVAIDALPIKERKASLLLDTSRAFLIWGKHDKAFSILRAAGEIAPEEITERPATLRLVREIATTAPVTVRRSAREYAQSLGITA